MKKQKVYYCIKIPEVQNLYLQRRYVLQEQQKLLNTLSNPKYYANLVISLRYLWNPSKVDKDKRLEIYFVISSTTSDPRKAELASDLLIRGNLSQFYDFQIINYLSTFTTQFTWVNYISEIIKQSDTLNAQLENDMVHLCCQLNKLEYPVMVDLTLQTCQLSDYKNIEDNFNQNKAAPKQYFYKHNLKVLAANEEDLHLIATALLQNSLTNHHYNCENIIFKPDSDRFHELLNATKRVDLVEQVEGGHLTPTLIRPRSQSRRHYENFIRLPETEPIEPSIQPESGKIVKQRETWSLGKYFKGSSEQVSQVPSNTLSSFVTPQEVGGFFRLVIAGETGIPGIPLKQVRFPKTTATDLFKEYLLAMPPEKYLVGLADDGHAVYSDWSQTSHCLVAGITRSGKTNFLNWLIFQFLYTQQGQKVYIIDFKEVDFNFYKNIQELRDSVELIQVDVTEKEQCEKLLDTLSQIQSKYYKKRQQVFKEQGFQNIQQSIQCGFPEYRVLVVIDEGADISEISISIRDKIERVLKFLARKGGGFGIHLIYCTQIPKNDIHAQFTTQLDSRIVFRIKDDLSGGGTILGKLFDPATKIDKKFKGRCIFDSSEGDLYVNTPLIEIPQPQEPLPEIWKQLVIKYK